MEQLSLRTTGIEPVLWRLEAAAAEACVPSSLCPTRAATAVRNPGTAAGEEPPPAATREELMQQQRPRTARDKEIYIKKLENNIQEELTQCETSN